MGGDLGKIISQVDWSRRYSQQARWTASIRSYLFDRIGLKDAGRILDVGCGTGALEAELVNRARAAIIGLDIDRSALAFAELQNPNPKRVVYTHGDALNLPFHNAAFDLCLCHFFLLWVSDPVRSIREMLRVTRPGGQVLALAEPDYGGRIDYPDELASLGKLQADALRRQGANHSLGRHLGAIFSQAGLEVVETGVMGGQWRGAPSHEDWEAEWHVLEADLAGELSKSQIDNLRSLDAVAWQRGERVLFVPTFYAWGKV